VSKRDSDENKYSREALFQKRLADLRAENQQFPWNIGDVPEFEIPKDQSKLFADRYIEDPSLSDEEVERRALLDLTSYNFWSFYKRLNYELRRARRYKRDLSLLLVAVDGLSNVSNKYGLTAENAVVLGAGRVLLGSIRDVDVAGRCRDDTFGIILPETPMSGSEVAAERVRTRMEEHEIVYEGKQISITASVGGTSFSGDDEQVDIMVAKAIEALKSCLDRGGNWFIGLVV